VSISPTQPRFRCFARVFFPIPVIGSRAQVEENKDGEWRPGRDADDVGLHGPDIVPVFRSVLKRRGLLRLVVTLQTFFLWLLLLVSGGRRVEPEASSSEPARTKAHRRRTATEEEDVRRCRALAEEVVMAGHLPRPRGQGERALLLAAREMR
jgi:hypothetical protein